MGHVRTLINLTLVEGFGLVPLEAMAMGTMVTGLDGLAGRDYMRSGDNCLVTSFDQLDTLPSIVHQALSDDALAERCVESARNTARQYSFAAFESAWLKTLSGFLDKAPHYA